MPLLDLYSRRKRQAEKAGQPDVYQYEDVPREVRVQIIQIWRDAIGPFPPPPHPCAADRYWWLEIHEVLCREKGLFTLADGRNAFERCANYLLGASKIEDVLDVIEVTFRLVHRLRALEKRQWESQARQRGLRQRPDDAIEELNFRLLEAAVGYQFENGRILRVDSQYLHANAVKPALTLLSDPRFEGPHQEFLHAHERYRAARPGDSKVFEDAITNALKAFESVLKVICDLKGWTDAPKATANGLIECVVRKNLVPPFLKPSLLALATLRDNVAAHGQGQPRDIPAHLAAYALHLAASDIVMLIEAFKETEWKS